MTTDEPGRALSAEAALRLLDDVRKLSLDSAAAVVERFSSLIGVAGSTTGDAAGPASGGGLRLVPGRAPVLRAKTARAVEAYLALTRELYEATLAIAEEAGAGRPDDPVVLPPIGPGGSASTTLWVHVTGPNAEAAELVAGPLFGATGMLDGALVRLSPNPVLVRHDEPARVTVAVDVPTGAEPGTYRGHVVVRGHADAAIVLAVPVGRP